MPKINFKHSVLSLFFLFFLLVSNINASDLEDYEKACDANNTYLKKLGIGDFSPEQKEAKAIDFELLKDAKYKGCVSLGSLYYMGGKGIKQDLVKAKEYYRKASLGLGAVTLTSSYVRGGARKGQKLFLKKFKKYCNFSGTRFSIIHTQNEWKMFWDKYQFIEELKRICPKLKLREIKRYYWKPVYLFAYWYAKDTGALPGL